MNDYFRDLQITQEIRINEAGANAYQDYTNPKEQGTIFSNRYNFSQWNLQFKRIKPTQNI